jgi:glyoxylase-like metal-dependent hydrolase (beta-lactamase superfamily II)
MNLSKTTFGQFNLYTIETGDFKLDGGAMFGVVPKTLWSRGIEADEKNRITMTMRCLLVESQRTGKLYLIDNGVGSKFNDKMMDIYQIDFSEKALLGSLKHHGFSADDITDVIFTHLHFDHCGGTTYFDEAGELAFTFSNANYHINKRHWDTAIHPNAREKASFLPDNIEPLKSSDKVVLIEDHHEFEAGLSTYIVNGHTIGQQLPLLSDGRRTLLFAADLLPTHVHVPLPWVMGYDMYPTETLLEKERFLKQACEENWFIYLEHDAEKEIITLAADGKKVKVDQSLTLNDL